MKNICIFLSFLLGLTACQKNQNSDGSVEVQNIADPEIQLSQVVSGECLNIEKLSQLLSRPQFQFPGVSIVTDFKVLTETTRAGTNYHSFSAFNLQTMPVNQFEILHKPVQSDCQTVTATMASGEPLIFKITASTKTYLLLELTQNYRVDLADYKKQAFISRPQPYRYEILMPNEKSLHLNISYIGFDALCAGKKMAKYQIFKEISWDRPDSLPKNFLIKKEFAEKVLEAYPSTAAKLFEEPPNEDSNPAPSDKVSWELSSIETLLRTRPRDDIKICQQ